MNVPDNIFNIALDRLQAGESVQAIASDYPDYQQELAGLLVICEMGMDIPKLVPPIPYKRHLYAEKVTAKTKLWNAFVYSRIAIVPIALLIALLGGRVVATATAGSLPGDTLYTLKRATEKARLTLTRNPEKLAIIHVQLMQKRVDEVRQAVNTGNPAVESAALAELQSQTNTTFAEAATVATAKAISSQDSTLLDNLVAVNKQQNDLLQDLSEQEENTDAKTVASTALADNKKNDETLAKIVATVNDQILIDMPNKVSVTGTITDNHGLQVTVEKNTFIINSKTTISNIDGTVITDHNTTLTGRANVIGTRSEDGTLVARQILLLADEPGEVKGDVTPAPVTPKPVPVIKPTDPTPTPITPAPVTPTPSPAPNQATAAFISEPATQQYSN